MNNFFFNYDYFDGAIKFLLSNEDFYRPVIIVSIFMMFSMELCHMYSKRYTLDSDYEYLYEEKTKIRKLYYDVFDLILFSVNTSLSLGFFFTVITGGENTEGFRDFGIMMGNMWLAFVVILVLKNVFHMFRIYKRIGIGSK